MSDGIRMPNGMAIYLLSKLTNYFETISCQAIGNSINFICAQDYLSIILKIFYNSDLFLNEKNKWNYSYAFKSKHVKNNIDWFRNKANSNEKKILNIIPSENNLHIYNDEIDATLHSYVENPPIPMIPEMEDGVQIKISNLNKMVNQIKAINGEVVKLANRDTSFIMMSSSNESPIYTIPISHENEIGVYNGKSTRCFKSILLTSCQIASELRSAELRYYNGGAIQIMSKGDYTSVRCLLTTV